MIGRFISHAINLFRHATRDVLVGKKRSSQWPALEKRFKKEHPVCEICGSSVRVQVHHRLPFHIHSELELDENNLISGCMSQKECHLRIFHGGSFRAYSASIEEDVKILKADISRFEEVAAKAKQNRLYE